MHNRTYTHRPLLAEDLAAICSLPQNAEELYYMFPKAVYPLTPEQIEEALRTRLEPTVVLYGREIAAYANLYNYDGDSCWLGNVIVAAGHRGKGASRYLVETMESIAKNGLHARRLRLVCHNTNTRGILFYHKLGYRPFDISARTKPTGEPIAGIHMEKVLL
jgi:RimJ/RimL family protein N-acetyltransferase